MLIHVIGLYRDIPAVSYLSRSDSGMGHPLTFDSTFALDTAPYVIESNLMKNAATNVHERVSYKPTAVHVAVM
jgi:hypothetical protein